MDATFADRRRGTARATIWGVRPLVLCCLLLFTAGCGGSPRAATPGAAAPESTEVTEPAAGGTDTENAATGACALLTKADAETLLGTAVQNEQDLTAQGTSCDYYEATAQPDANVSLTTVIDGDGPETTFEALNGACGEPVSGVGDKAAVDLGRGEGICKSETAAFVVLKGDDVFKIRVTKAAQPVTSDALQALAEKILARQ